ncbi:HAMP domain-containing protein, partial [Nocardioides caldifontis]|uniref:HAMP domain-containing protein n=1 Tax=Nocardioides caldifontis TaxID=2588938 RepID=UPI0011DF7D68
MRTITRRLRNLRIGVRLAVILTLCGLCIGAAAYNGLSSQSRSDAFQEDMNAVQDGRQIADELLISINDVTGWQGLYLADAAAYGVERALGPDGYNAQGLADAKKGVEELFATADTSGLTADEKAVVAETEEQFTQFFAEDAKIQQRLRTDGVSALPGIMKSINGGDAGAAWSAVYDATDRLKVMIDERLAEMRAELQSMKDSGRRSVYVGLLLAVVLATGLVRVLVRSITRPVGETVAALREVAEGRLGTRVDVVGKDEVADMGTALNVALDRMSETLRGIEASSQALASASEELSSVSMQMSGSAQESASQSELVSAAAEQVTRNV